MAKHAVILAGGCGSRLWPVSRESRPKQFQNFMGSKTLIQQTCHRLRGLIRDNRIWVVTSQRYCDLVREQLKEVLVENIIIEPEARNTAAAIALATLTIAQSDPQALIGVFPSDHHLGREKEFRRCLKTLYSFVERNPDSIGLLGLNPTEPNTGLGYIQMGSQIGEINGQAIFEVSSFHEKPDLETAKKFFDSWEYLWNGGYFFFRADKAITKFERYAGEIVSGVRHYMRTNDKRSFSKIPAAPIDKALIEKTDGLAVLPADLEWSDLGSWATLHEIFREKDNEGTTILGQGIDIDSQNCLVISKDKPIAIVGLDNVIIVNTDDALLVCRRDKSQMVKFVVDKLKAGGKHSLI